MSMSNLRLALIVVVAFALSATAARSTGVLSRSEWERLSHPPLDSVQARDTRIWFSSQVAGKCRTKIEVVDTSGQTVRRITDEMLGRGFYNLYWDKKDDSGRFVQRGLYYYRISSACEPEMKRKLWVSYRPFEKVVRMTVDTADMDAAALIAVDTPKVRLSLDVYRADGHHVDSLCPDTVLAAGIHRVVWRPKSGAALGEYLLRMKIDEYVVQEKIRMR